MREGETVFGVERPVVGWRLGGLWPRGFMFFFVFCDASHKIGFYVQTLVP